MSGMWTLINAVTGEDVFLQLSEHIYSLLGFEQSTIFDATTMSHYPPGKLRGLIAQLTTASDSWFNLTWALEAQGSPGIYSTSDVPDGYKYGDYNCELKAWVELTPRVRNAPRPCGGVPDP